MAKITLEPATLPVAEMEVSLRKLTRRITVERTARNTALVGRLAIMKGKMAQICEEMQQIESSGGEGLAVAGDASPKTPSSRSSHKADAPKPGG